MAKIIAYVKVQGVDYLVFFQHILFKENFA